MFWIALLVTPNELQAAWAWRALRFTPRVAQLEEALVLEVAASERLFGGRRQLLRDLLDAGPDLPRPRVATGPVALLALALLRLRARSQAPPARVPDDLPLDLLTAAREHLPTLERIGCTTWGQLRALPRAGVARRFGAGLLQALDTACGERPESHGWLILPADFDRQLELPELATTSDDLLLAGQHLLTLLQAWLQARNLGVLALEFEWTLDLRRVDGKPLPPTECMALRTAQPTQDMHHLRRLAREQFARVAIAAPANHLRLRSLETVPWGGASTSLLPEDNRPGDRLHQLVERLSVRLGEGNVTTLQPRADHRPECMQASVPFMRSAASASPVACAAPLRTLPPPMVRSGAAHPAKSVTHLADPLYPPWLLPEPLELEVRGGVAHYHGPIQRLARHYRVETAWWEEGGAVLRDYFVARSEGAGLLWVFRERPLAFHHEFRWFLQGLYA